MKFGLYYDPIYDLIYEVLEKKDWIYCTGSNRTHYKKTCIAYTLDIFGVPVTAEVSEINNRHEYIGEI